MMLCPRSSYYWRCKQCNRLLGMVDEHKIHIRYKDSTQYVIEGTVIAICRRCGRVNQTSSLLSPAVTLCG